MEEMISICGLLRCMPYQQGREALPTTMFDEEKDELMDKAHSAILLCLSNDVLSEVVKKDTTTKL